MIVGALLLEGEELPLLGQLPHLVRPVPAAAVVVVVLTGPGPGQASDISHQRFVVGPAGVLKVPAAVAEVVETAEISTEVRTLL